MKTILITGSAGLIGSQCVEFFIDLGYFVVGIDNDMRKFFFGSESSTEKITKLQKESFKNNFKHFDVDIRNNEQLEKIFKEFDFEIIIHSAAQPSHDWASKNPNIDFTINAVGTLNMLENFRKFSPGASFIFTSTNKVYGDTPNYPNKYNVENLQLVELATRYEMLKGNERYSGINEEMTVDNSKHSLFGVSKLSGDFLVQEYGKYFGLNTVCFRCGCLTGPNHQGAELHGFLSYLVKCILSKKEYNIFGYKGKQVRDNIHSYDLVTMFFEFHKNPKKGVVYNVGGGRENSISILEAIDYVNNKFETKWNQFTINETPRIGDHIWYITDLNKFKKDYPMWSIKYSVFDTIDQIVLEVKKNMKSKSYFNL